MKFRVFLSALFLPILGFSQGVNNNWIMGYESFTGTPFFGISTLNFLSGTPIIGYDSLAMEFHHTHTNISDSLGNILFYTNGYYIADASDDTMQNGSGINPGQYAISEPNGLLIPQGALALKKPGSDSIYYLFHDSYDNYPQSSNAISFQLYKTEIDMSLNGGLGSVISKNVPVIIDSLNCGKITACKHANGRDWWLMVHKANSNLFYKLLITPNAILGPYTQNIGSIRSSDAGQSWFSPDGTKYAYFWINGGLDIFDFNRCTGQLNNPVHINLAYENGYNVGIAFSPNSNVLYVSNVFHIYQYDLTSANIPASQTVVATYDSFMCTIPGFPDAPTVFGLSELAPDGKIYITSGNSTLQMHVIDDPNTIGINCNVIQHGVTLPTLYFNTLPNHPNYFLGCDTTLGCGCLTALNNISSTELKLKLFPNPTKGNFTLQFNVKNEPGAIEIFDINGRMLLQENIAAWSQYKQINIENFPNGIYFCKLNWGTNQSSIKIIKE